MQNTYFVSVLNVLFLTVKYNPKKPYMNCWCNMRKTARFRISAFQVKFTIFYNFLQFSSCCYQTTKMRLVNHSCTFIVHSGWNSALGASTPLLLIKSKRCVFFKCFERFFFLNRQWQAQNILFALFFIMNKTARFRHIRAFKVIITLYCSVSQFSDISY